MEWTEEDERRQEIRRRADHVCMEAATLAAAQEAAVVLGRTLHESEYHGFMDDTSTEIANAVVEAESDYEIALAKFTDAKED